MPFQTPAGPAVLLENICDVGECAIRLGVHVNSIYNWVRAQENTKFPSHIAKNHYDYAEVYDWFKEWVLEHPAQYPDAFLALTGGPK